MVELALILPVFLALIIAVFEVGFLMLGILRVQNGINVLADLAAVKPGWESKLNEEDQRTGCHASGHPDVEYPDGNSDSGSRILLTWHCEVTAPVSGLAIPVTVSSEAVIGGKGGQASPSPSP